MNVSDMPEMNDDEFEIKPFSRMRLPVIDVMRIAQRKHIVHGILEVDVTEARQFIREHKIKSGKRLSFTAFVATCLGKAVDENKYLHARRDWRGRLVLFDDVDVKINVEVKTGSRSVPLPYVIRAANKKAFRAIHEEIRQVQQEGGGSRAGKEMRLFASLPGFMRRGYWTVVERKPQAWKARFGTVGLTSVGMFGMGGGWGIPLSSATLTVTAGGIKQKPKIMDGQIQDREYLSLTVSFDHDIVDGGPAARFTQRLQELLQHCYGLLGQDLNEGQAVKKFDKTSDPVG
jgi:pyruvate/2-oxoglutarate dehydrogenase complex dihydrolipoamide acyltransferase (E2) component